MLLSPWYVSLQGVPQLGSVRTLIMGKKLKPLSQIIHQGFEFKENIQQHRHSIFTFFIDQNDLT